MKDKKEKLIRGHRRESVLFTLPELQDLRGNNNTHSTIIKFYSITHV